MAEGFFTMRDKQVCKACGHDGGTVEDGLELGGSRFWCARPGCPNGREPLEDPKEMARVAVTEMSKQIRALGEHCAVMCDGLEAFVHYTPPDKAIAALTEARKQLFGALSEIAKSFEPDKWSPEALARLAMESRKE